MRSSTVSRLIATRAMVLTGTYDTRDACSLCSSYVPRRTGGVTWPILKTKSCL